MILKADDFPLYILLYDIILVTYVIDFDWLIILSNTPLIGLLYLEIPVETGLNW